MSISIFIGDEHKSFTRIARVFPNLIEISGKNIDEAGLRVLCLTTFIARKVV